eukprot:TRINITY_DN4771_c0_g1_i2.p1 TRINITY_DN4771_c0_g1~~TRINITY_DN4771_c0_g1_i2.p1  ORF type:complete len:109 (+),score=22.02 TRINITY_DN4771_c0_g1_i2:47-373(+)
MKSKVVIITSKAKNLEESPSRRRMATTAKKDSEVEVHLGSTESPYRTYYTYEEFMCDKLSEYLDELQFFRKKVNEAEKSIIKSFHLSLIHICRCRRYAVCRSRWSPYH